MKLKPFFLLCCLAVSMAVTAQTKPPVKPAVAPAMQKFKPPRLYTSIGSQKDSIITMGVNDAINLVNQSIQVTDEKKGVYSITSYQCLYKRKAVTEDEETGKVSPTTSTVVQRFTSTPLSEIWRKTIYEQLKAGEEISFFDIVVKDSQNRLMFAPGFKIIVK
ncbi:MAG: hypothetical protein U0V75_05235 [Ferruginibacter sp.]